jgi:hypothetical protein
VASILQVVADKMSEYLFNLAANAAAGGRRLFKSVRVI